MDIENETQEFIDVALDNVCYQNDLTHVNNILFSLTEYCISLPGGLLQNQLVKLLRCGAQI